MRSDNPMLAEMYRSGRLESMHRGAWVLTDPAGVILEHAGDPTQGVYPRSATKSLQALPLVESGAADRFEFDDRQLALACASHSGEPRHVAAAADGLSAIGLGPAHLLCGPQRPFHSSADVTAERIVNNCSGKHVGFLAVAVHLETATASYLEPDGVVQMLVRTAIAEMTDTPFDELGLGVDGCSAPTVHLPLSGLATGLARLTNPEGLASERAEACRRLTDAARHHPDFVAGTHERFCTDLMAATDGRVFGKIGAEGVYTFGVVGEGVGFAGKADDGNARPLYPLMIDLLRRRGLITSGEVEALDRWASTVVRNWDGLDVGHIQIHHPSITPTSRVDQ